MSLSHYPSMNLHPFKNEEALVAALILGDPDAAGVFVRRWSPVIYGIARQEFRLSEADAQDVFQSVFERLCEKDFRRLRLWNGRGSLGGYLRRLVRNLIIDRLRGSHDCPEPDLDPEEGEVDEPVRGLVRDAEAECIRGAIDHLRDRDQRLIRRRHWQEASYRDIAEAEDMSVNNVGVALLRAERRLAAWIERLCADLIDCFSAGGRVR